LPIRYQLPPLRSKLFLLMFPPVSADPSSMAAHALTQTNLESLVESFDRDAGNRNRIRELMDGDALAFKDSAIRVLKSSSSSRGAQFVIRLLISSNLLMQILCDAALTMEEAVSLARKALQIDPLADVNLAKNLADDCATGGLVPYASRLMDVLGKISNGNRITPLLMPLLRNPDPQMRSKAVLLIGRGNRNVKWLKGRMTEPDPRTRANAVEALWDVDTAEAKELIRTCARDDDNRVAGNALFALYQMGDTGAIPELFKMAAHESSLFRSSAAWAMGETRDPRFSGTLGRMVGEPNTMVRKRAFSALGRVKAATAKARQGQEWRVVGLLQSGPEGMRQFRLEVAAADKSEPPQLLATQFILSEDGQPVTNYQVETNSHAATITMTFLFPSVANADNARPWVLGALNCLSRKSPSDRWCATFYGSASEPPQAPANSLRFAADSKAVAAALENPPGETECLAFWECLRNAVRGAGGPSHSPRHLIVYSPTATAEAADIDSIVSAAVSSNCTVNAVSLTPNAPLEDLCRRTQGSFRLAPSEADIANLIDEAHLTLAARFLVRYHPALPTAETLTVRVFGSAGWGETKISLSATSGR
jgi:hypothetical protein